MYSQTIPPLDDTLDSLAIDPKPTQTLAWGRRSWLYYIQVQQTLQKGCRVCIIVSWTEPHTGDRHKRCSVSGGGCTGDTHISPNLFHLNAAIITWYKYFALTAERVRQQHPPSTNKIETSAQMQDRLQDWCQQKHTHVKYRECYKFPDTHNLPTERTNSI